MAVTAVTGLAAAAPSAAQPEQTGLVNVVIVDNTVQIPIGIAANVCGVTVNILAAGILTGPTDCKAVAGATATAPPRKGGGHGNARQTGLVNLYVANNTIQVPVGIAANLCGITANILATAVGTAGATCDAKGNADADAGEG